MEKSYAWPAVNTDSATCFITSFSLFHLFSLVPSFPWLSCLVMSRLVDSFLSIYLISFLFPGRFGYSGILSPKFESQNGTGYHDRYSFKHPDRQIQGKQKKLCIDITVVITTKSKCSTNSRCVFLIILWLQQSCVLVRSVSCSTSSLFFSCRSE